MIKQSVKFFGIFAFCTIALTVYAIAQQISVDAIVLRIRGGVKLIEAGAEIAIKFGIKLSPYQIITTDNTGRMEIVLTDESRVTVLPNSTVKLNEFRKIGSPRDLLTVLAGKIKVKINHPIGIPNPYKLSTPAASIAVRGTEFIVDVESNGSTSVFVIDGLVEVGSISNPSNKRLLSTGEKAIIKLNGDISLNIPAGPGSELSGIPRSRGGLDWTNREMTEGVFIRSLRSIPLSFGAYSDRYSDSAENPAYSATIRDIEGRITLLPSFGSRNINKSDKVIFSSPPLSEIIRDKYDTPSNWDKNINTQFSIFAPLFNSRIIAGATVSSSHINLRDYINTDYQPYYLYSPDGLSYTKYMVRSHIDNDYKLSATKLILSAAIPLGKKKKTSIGIAYDVLFGKSNFLGVYERETKETKDLFSRIYSIRSNLAGSGVSVGITHEFSGGKKLGWHTRVGSGTSSENSDLRATGNNFPQSCNPLIGSTTLHNNSYESGFKWRSPLFKGITYGIEGSYLYEHITTDNIQYSVCESQVTLPSQFQNIILNNAENIVAADPSRRARIGGGLGYKIKSRTLVSFDVTYTHINSTRTVIGRTELAASYFPTFKNVSNKNVSSYHGGIISNPWKQSSVSFSLYAIPSTENGYYYGKTMLRSFGAGWNFKSGAQLQYYLSGYVPSLFNASHSIMLRWNFNLKDDK